MERVRKAMGEELKYNHLPTFRRVAYFFWRKRVRFVAIGIGCATFSMWGNPLGLVAA